MGFLMLKEDAMWEGASVDDVSQVMTTAVRETYARTSGRERLVVDAAADSLIGLVKSKEGKKKAEKISFGPGLAREVIASLGVWLDGVKEGEE